MTRVFEDKPAVREMTPLLIGMTSPSGGGKTYSALRLATGIQEVLGGDIFHVDTEASRALHYADTFKFRHVPFGPPFAPLDYLAAIQHCAKKGAGVIIVDSTSHEHDGPGGVLEMHEAELLRLGGGQKNNFRAWQKPKAERRALINGILQLQTCFIFCFRAKEKIKPAKKNANDQGEGGMVSLGWMPIGGEEFIYELTLSLLFLHNSDGKPNLDFQSLTESQRDMFKVPGQFRSLFSTEKQLDERIGRDLALWATGGKKLDPSVRDRNTVAAATHRTTSAPQPKVGPDQSEPCAFCKNNPPSCKACKRPLLFRKSGISQQGTVYEGFWGCPEKCKNPADKRQNTNYNALDWHAILDGDQRAGQPAEVREPGQD